MSRAAVKQREAPAYAAEVPTVWRATMLKLSLVRLDGGTQPRATTHQAVVDEYVADLAGGAKFPPPVVFFDGAVYWLADGFHRVLAATGLGLEELLCDVRLGTRRDAVLHSCGANAAHGLRRTREDKQRAVRTMLNDPEWANWSDREIARRAKVDGKTVASLRPPPSKPDMTAEIRSEEASRTYTTRHGGTATMRTANIGASPLSPAEATPSPAPPEAAEHSEPSRAPPSGFEGSDPNWKVGQPVANFIFDIEERLEQLPDPAAAYKLFPQSLKHSLSKEQLLHAASWLIAFAAELEVEHVAA